MIDGTYPLCTGSYDFGIEREREREREREQISGC